MKDLNRNHSEEFNKRTINIMRDRFCGERKMTYKGLGEKYNISLERIRQIIFIETRLMIEEFYD